MLWRGAGGGGGGGGGGRECSTLNFTEKTEARLTFSVEKTSTFLGAKYSGAIDWIYLREASRAQLTSMGSFWSLFQKQQGGDLW